jgi:hypothetical protein
MADGEPMSLAPRDDNDFGPVPLFEVPEDLPPGKYRFSARVIDPVTGDVLSEDTKPVAIGSAAESRDVAPESEPTLEAELSEAGEYSITNVGTEEASFEVKMWLESPGKAPIPILSLGADGSLVLPAGGHLTLDPMALIEPPSGMWVLRARLLDQATGRILSESVTP